MITRKKKICNGCGKEEFIWAGGKCKRCAPQKKYVYKRKKTGEADLFKTIWDQREHKCTNCQIGLGDEMNVFYFAHIVPKGREPSLRLDSNNIRLLCKLCHITFDHGTKEQFEAREGLFK